MPGETNYNIIKYLLNAVDNNYIEKIDINNISEYKISIKCLVSNSGKLRPILDMIEANLYTNKKLLSESITRYDNIITVRTFQNIVYDITVTELKNKD